MLEFSHEIFAIKLFILRKSYGLTQEEVGTKIGCKRSTYARYELGDAEPPLSILLKISRAFGVSADELLDPEPLRLTVTKRI